MPASAQSALRLWVCPSCAYEWAREEQDYDFLMVTCMACAHTDYIEINHPRRLYSNTGTYAPDPGEANRRAKTTRQAAPK